jgi:hypothetical protein
VRYFFTQINRERPPKDASVLSISRNLVTGKDDFSKAFGELSSLESDLLVLASSIFAADRAYARGEREDIARNVRLSVPVVNYARLIPLIPLVEKALYRLSSDSWEIEFRQRKGSPEKKVSHKVGTGQTLLFSGGLDSLAGAIEFGGVGSDLQLVSHVTRNRITRKSQKELKALLTSRGYASRPFQCFISSRSGGPTGLEHDEENSQRTRSFVFLVIGAIAARRAGHGKLIYLAENGQMAIHLPLTHGRVGAFSTHTAHPEVLTSIQEFVSNALNVAFTIDNPYVHKTKKEVVEVVYRNVPESIPVSNSCWRNARLPAGITHCGTCIPCYIRRIAIESHTADPTNYHRDPWIEDVSALPPDDDARRNIADLTELITRFENLSEEAILSEWPELYSPAINAREVIAMYRRFAGEARTVLDKYPMLRPFLS